MLPSTSVFFLKIHLFSTALRPSGKSTKVHTWFLYMDPISDFMASCHLLEFGLIIASSYVVGSSVLSTNMTLIIGSYQSGVVRVLVDLRGSVVTSTEVSWSTSLASSLIGVGATGTTSGAVLLASSREGLTTSSSSP